MEEEPTNQEYQDFASAYQPVAQRIRDNKGKDPGMEKAYHSGSQIELDTSKLLIIT
tara:strand:- start:675 stop:842 length:168 start_codon:yes stop_codon:yes gene_type:complete